MPSQLNEQVTRSYGGETTEQLERLVRQSTVSDEQRDLIKTELEQRARSKAKPRSAAQMAAGRGQRVFEVGRDEQSQHFAGEAGVGTLAGRIVAGEFPKDVPARIHVPLVEEGAAPAEPAWSTLEEVARSDFELRKLYQPVWTHTVRWLGYGILGGIVLKALDTTVLLFAIDEGLGLMWLLVLGSILVSNWIKFAPIVAGIIMLKSGANLFVTLLAVMAVGTILGAPIGMVIGTVIGLLKRDDQQTAPDAGDEGSKPLSLGLIVPGFLAIALLVGWFAVVNPMILDYLSGE